LVNLTRSESARPNVSATSLTISRVGERLEIRARTRLLPDDEAAVWAREWVTLL
jgi:hypothetical protein